MCLEKKSGNLSLDLLWWLSTKNFKFAFLKMNHFIKGFVKWIGLHQIKQSMKVKQILQRERDGFIFIEKKENAQCFYYDNDTCLAIFKIWEAPLFKLSWSYFLEVWYQNRQPAIFLELKVMKELIAAVLKKDGFKIRLFHHLTWSM